MKRISVIFLSLFLSVSAFGQGYDINRLRLENERLRIENDSLRRRLLLSLPETDPWEMLSGLDDDVASSVGDVPTIDALYVLLASPCLVLNYEPVIEKYIDRYLRSIGRQTSGALKRFAQHEAYFNEVFAQYGVPVELAGLSIVESAVSPKAVSVAGAAGVWQLMPDTARHLGLKVDAETDERFDIAKSTVAAAKYLRNAFEQLGDWSLVVMSYNCGIGNVRSAIVRAGGMEDPWSVLALLPAETRAYLPSLLAVNYIRKWRISV